MHIRALAGRAPRWLWPIVAGVAIAVAVLTLVEAQIGAEFGRDWRRGRRQRARGWAKSAWFDGDCQTVVNLVGDADGEV